MTLLDHKAFHCCLAIGEPFSMSAESRMVGRQRDHDVTNDSKRVRLSSGSALAREASHSSTNSLENFFSY